MIAKWVAVLLLATPAGIAGAQQPSTQAKPQDQQQQSQTQDRHPQQDPLAAAAKRAREQQKSQSPTAKVWDNDNLPSTADSISVVGKSGTMVQAAEGTSVPAAAANAGSQPAGKSTAGTDAAKAEIEKELAQAKAHLKSVQTDLDIATRTYQLDQQMFYGKPDYASDLQGAAKLKAEESNIAAKKQEVDDVQQIVDGLNARLKELENQPANSEKTPQ